MSETWTVPATLVRIVDGDTLVARLDLGWHVELETSIRIDGINAPELKTPEGDAAAKYLTDKVPPGTPLQIVSKKILGATDKYGRCLADVVATLGGKQVSIAQDMLASGHAKVWHGQGVKP